MTVIEVPVDDAPSKIRGRSAVRTDDNPDDIGVVDAKVRAFWAEHENGRIETDVKVIKTDGLPTTFLVTANVWKDVLHTAPDATGHALREYNDDDEPYGLFPLESAETVAIGRALRFLGITGEVPS